MGTLKTLVCGEGFQGVDGRGMGQESNGAA